MARIVDNLEMWVIAHRSAEPTLTICTPPSHLDGCLPRTRCQAPRRQRDCRWRHAPGFYTAPGFSQGWSRTAARIDPPTQTDQVAGRSRLAGQREVAAAGELPAAG